MDLPVYRPHIKTFGIPKGVTQSARAVLGCIQWLG